MDWGQVVVTVSGTWAAVAATYLKLRREMNGKSPNGLGRRLAHLEARLETIEDKLSHVKIRTKPGA